MYNRLWYMIYLKPVSNMDISSPQLDSSLSKTVAARLKQIHVS